VVVVVWEGWMGMQCFLIHIREDLIHLNSCLVISFTLDEDEGGGDENQPPTQSKATDGGRRRVQRGRGGRGRGAIPLSVGPHDPDAR